MPSLRWYIRHFLRYLTSSVFGIWCFTLKFGTSGYSCFGQCSILSTFFTSFCFRVWPTVMTVIEVMIIQVNYVYVQVMDNGMAHCTCQEGFFGDHCESHRPCNVYVCQNNGTCVYTPQADICYCRPGFSGLPRSIILHAFCHIISLTQSFPNFPFSVRLCCQSVRQSATSTHTRHNVLVITAKRDDVRLALLHDHDIRTYIRSKTLFS